MLKIVATNDGVSNNNNHADWADAKLTPKWNETVEDDPFGYCGEYYDAELEMVYLRNRYYSPSIGRFITEDPIKNGLNWYAYANNNPIMFVDPWGLAEWIFYGDDQEKFAKEFGEELINQGKEVYFIYVEKAEDFYEGWANMGYDKASDEVSIDTVYIQVHGHPEYIVSSNGQPINADKLEIKTIDTIILTACSTGNMDFSNNFASQLAMTQDVNQVIAPDGLGQLPVPYYASANYFSDISGVERTGNGFTMYQKIQDKLHITPNLSFDKNPIRLSGLRKIGEMYSFMNQQYSYLREGEYTMNIAQLINRIVGLE